MIPLIIHLAVASGAAIDLEPASKEEVTNEGSCKHKDLKWPDGKQPVEERLIVHGREADAPQVERLVELDFWDVVWIHVSLSFGVLVVLDELSQLDVVVVEEEPKRNPEFAVSTDIAPVPLQRGVRLNLLAEDVCERIVARLEAFVERKDREPREDEGVEEADKSIVRDALEPEDVEHVVVQRVDVSRRVLLEQLVQLLWTAVKQVACAIRRAESDDLLRTCVFKVVLNRIVSPLLSGGVGHGEVLEKEELGSHCQVHVVAPAPLRELDHVTSLRTNLNPAVLKVVSRGHPRLGV